MLAGRIADTAPFSWSGTEQTLKEHMGITFKRGLPERVAKNDCFGPADTVFFAGKAAAKHGLDAKYIKVAGRHAGGVNVADGGSGLRTSLKVYACRRSLRGGRVVTDTLMAMAGSETSN